MATGEQIITGKPYVETLGDEDALFVNQGNTLRQIKKKKAGFITTEDLEEEVAPMVYGAYINKNVSGSIASFSDGGDGVPMKKCLVNITPKQSGTGTPSPDNVRAISGWESVDLWSGTANALDLSWWSGRTVNGITFTLQPNGKVRMHGTVTQAGWTFIDHEVSLPYNGIGAGDEMLLYSDSQIFIRFYDSNNTLIGDVVANNTSNVTAIPTTATKMRVYIYAFGEVPTAGTTHDVERSFYLSRNTTFTEWQPYTGTTTTTPLGRTVYGGTLDVVSGELTVDKEIRDIGSLPWNYYQASDHFYVTISTSATTGTNFMASDYEYRGVASAGDMANKPTGGLYRYSNIFRIKDTRFTDATAFKEENEGQTLCFQLATPQTYTLTPTQVNTLLGENNVWADAGAVDITYRADPTLAYQELANAVIALGGNL